MEPTKDKALWRYDRAVTIRAFEERVADRAASCNLPGVPVDGHDVIAMYEAAGEAVASASPRRSRPPSSEVSR